VVQDPDPAFILKSLTILISLHIHKVDTPDGFDIDLPDHIQP